MCVTVQTPPRISDHENQKSMGYVENTQKMGGGSERLQYVSQGRHFFFNTETYLGHSYKIIKLVIQNLHLESRLHKQSI